MHRMIKRLGAVAAVILLLSGCTQQEAQKEQEEQPRTMSMVIASDAPTSIQLAAQEFANRLAYYSDGELEISLSASDQLDAVLTADDTQFAFVENERLSKTIEQLETFALPFFFQDADYLFSGLNSERTRRQLNRLLEEEYPMEIQMSVVYGYEDLAADATVDLTDFRKRYPLAVTRSFFSQEQQQEIGALEIEGEEPLQMLLDKEVEIAPVELSELVQTVQSQDSALVLLESSHQLKPAYLMMQTGLYEQLTPKQQAAVEQAVEALKAAGVRRCVMLNVSGPFHSPMMIPAGEALDQEMADMQWSELKIPYVTNVTAEYVTDIHETRALLAKQVASSVRWQASMERMIADGVDTFVEIGPGKTLAGFMRKINRNAKVYTVNTVEDAQKVIEELRQLII